ncbi:hypothetical protein Trydic_g9403 [Trypoxylus dichotomus]
MPFNVMIQLCRITRASKLFQRNFYLPLLKPLSPKDALRRYLITGKNLLGNRIEHYIPVLEEYKYRQTRRKYKRLLRGKLVKKRLRKRQSMKYVTPFFDDDMEGHLELKELVSQKSKGKGQCYTYYVPDKDCTLVVTHQMERAIRDKQIIDITMAQRSEKILVTLSDNSKVTLPLVKYDGNAPFYRGEGWTRKYIEELHHHGKETMSLAKLFEAKESGVEEWELEMMRLANRRKRKMKGDGTADWKLLLQAAAENIDWDKFEEDAKTIVEEIKEPVEDEKIPMEVDDMEKTKNVNEKLKNAGPEVLAKLPLMPEIPELVKIMPEGTFTELANVTGMAIHLKSSGTERFVAGQMVKTEEGEMFVPGQTLTKEDGTFEYTPGFTIIMDDEVTLLPGLVMGDDPEKPVFLPGESTITETGELQFLETEADRDPTHVSSPEVSEPEESEESEESEKEEKKEEPKKEEPKKIQVRQKVVRKVVKIIKKAPVPVKGPPSLPKPPTPPPEESSSEEVSEEEEEEEVEVPKPPPPPKKPPQEFKYERPKRPKIESQGIKRREKPVKPPVKVKSAVQKALEAVKSDEPFKPYIPKKARIFEMTPINLEKDVIEQERERIKKMAAKKATEERSINSKRREIKFILKQIQANLPQNLPKYVPLEPVKKSERLMDLEASIRKGTFFTVDHKKYISPSLRYRRTNWNESFQFRRGFNTVGVTRFRSWRSAF